MDINLIMGLSHEFCNLTVQVVGIPLLKKELASITIPDISGSVNIAIGDVSYSIRGYVLEKNYVFLLHYLLSIKVYCV